MKAYVLTAGDYSDYYIVGVQLDKNRAEEIAGIMNKAIRYDHDKVRVEEYDTDTFSLFTQNSKAWRIEFTEKNHIIVSCDAISDFAIVEKPICHSFKDVWIVYVYAEDKEHAIKSASDKLAKYLAEQADI